MQKEPKGIFLEDGKEPIINRITELALRYPSRSAAAREWGVNINTLNSYYKHNGEPPMPRDNVLRRIAESEGVSLEWLKTGEGETSAKTTESPKTPSCDDELHRMLSFLTEQERSKLIKTLARKGVEIVLYLLDEENIELMHLDRVVKEKILGKQPATIDEADQNAIRARECGSDTESQTATPSLTEKKQAV